MFFRYVTKHACDGHTDIQTDARTNRQNYDPQDRDSIAGSRGKKNTFLYFHSELSQMLTAFHVSFYF